MSLKVFNTLARRKEEFRPVTQGKVGIYVCGVTVYDRCHMGHARAAVAFDFIYRALEHLGFEVTYVRNFTDIDDKIINRAAEKGIPCEELVEENIAAFYEDMDALYVRRPTHEPRATNHMAEMIKLIEELVEKGHAYQADGDVFYAVRSFPEYGTLSGKKIEELMEGARVEVSDKKRDPLDFALWKAAKPGEPKWPSPWGEGRPGWHIECSAMSRELLGMNFDIHGGGMDLIFPHHENEIAQSQGACGCRPANYWLHNGFVNINREKMSKSLGNFFTIRDVLEKFDAEAVRLYLISTHYRSPIDFADPYLLEAERSLDRFYATALRAEELLGEERGRTPEKISDGLREMLEDDFNSALVVALLNETATVINSLCDGFSGKDRQQTKTLADYSAALREIGGLLGIFQRKPSDYMERTKEKRIAQKGITVAEIEQAIRDREQARAEKDYAKADAIRQKLAEKGIELKDSADGTGWSAKAG